MRVSHLFMKGTKGDEYMHMYRHNAHLYILGRTTRKCRGLSVGPLLLFVIIKYVSITIELFLGQH